MAAFRLSPEDLQTLTPEQRDAILDALVVAVVSDANVAPAEIARFNAEVGAVPWGRSMDEVVRMAQAARARVMGLKNDGERLAMLKSISARLPSAEVKGKVFAMMARVMLADRAVNVTEKNVLKAFALAFGLSDEQVNDVLARGLLGARPADA